MKKKVRNGNRYCQKCGSPRTVMNHYIISSNRNYDACDIADCAVNGYIVKTNNLYFNRTCLSRKE